MPPKVLYIDYEGHPAPLSRCFHATASRQLSSSVARHPPTTKTTVDSAYCPQCFSFNDATTAASIGYCESCKQCPLCMAIASVAVDETTGQAFYKCGYCEWNSKECGIVTTIALEKDEPMDKEKMMKASKTLADMAKTKRDESLAAQKSHYQDLMTTWEQEMKKDKQQPLKVKRGGIQQQTLQAWNLESLEKSLVAKQQTKVPNVMGKMSESVVMLDDSPTILDSTLQDIPTTSLLLQPIASCNAIPTFSKELLPLPLPLRARTSRRCLAELKEKRPGILVKPKLNPLEGDSSLKSGHGQWWKKDSSAIHTIPKLTIAKHEYSQQTSFLVKLVNPNMCMVRLRLAPSDYTTQGSHNHTIKHVLMDSLEVEYRNVLLDCNAASNMPATDFVGLESVQDFFLDSGRTKLPDAVVNWTGSESTSEETFCRLVASQKDVAWFELHVNSSATIAGSDDDSYVAVPIALQIQVGDGSWESSLIKQKEMDEPDLVTFDLLIAWETNNTNK